MWVFHRADPKQLTARRRAEETASKLRNLEHRELDLLSRLAVLQERHELYPREVTERQVAELDRKLDEMRDEIAALRAGLPTSQSVGANGLMTPPRAAALAAVPPSAAHAPHTPPDATA
ncbi:MAG: hypothetical protein ACXVY6_09205 [Gaiellaceae bacterium]